jgi:hypothetical protein
MDPTIFLIVYAKEGDKQATAARIRKKLIDEIFENVLNG